jgi:hypothetical protein
MTGSKLCCTCMEALSPILIKSSTKQRQLWRIFTEQINDKEVGHAVLQET